MIRRFIARWRLQQIVTRTRNSFACQQYRKHRDAGKLGWQRRRAAQ